MTLLKCLPRLLRPPAEASVAEEQRCYVARVTVEDCLQKIDNRFSLVLIAARRTRRILQGDPPLVSHAKNNKEAVTALREIAAGRVVARNMSEDEYQAEIDAQVAADRARELGLLHRL